MLLPGYASCFILTNKISTTVNCALNAFSFSLKMLKCHVIFSFWRQGVYVSVCMYVCVGGLLMIKLESCLKFIYIVGECCGAHL